MKEQINFSTFCDRFKSMDRDNQFSYEGKEALFNYLETYEEDTKQEIELDIIALCCEYNEYKDLNEYLQDYKTDLNKDDFANEEDFKNAIEEDINNKTTLIKFGDNLNEGFIIQGY